MYTHALAKTMTISFPFAAVAAPVKSLDRDVVMVADVPM